MQPMQLLNQPILRESSYRHGCIVLYIL